MRNKINYLILVLILSICGTLTCFSQSDRFIPENSTIISSGKADIMLRQCSRAVPTKVNSYFDLTINDIQGLENNFKKVLKLKATECCLSGGLIKSLKHYCFQYIGLIINGKRYIYINAFQIESAQDLSTIFKDWKTIPVIVCDGGESFWGVLYEIKNEIFTQLSINGVA